MQDDKKESAVPEELPEELIGPERVPDLESAHVGVRPETAPSSAPAELRKGKEGKEQEKPLKKAIEQVREQFTANQPAKDEEQDDEKLKALKEADKLRDMEHEGRKIEHLMHLAEKKGVDFAIEVARKTNDSCLLDLLHDRIIEKGLQNE